MKRIKQLLALCAAVVFSLSFAHAQTSTFLSTYGHDGVTERAHQILALEDGNLLLGGIRGDSVMLLKMDPSGQMLWDRTFKFGTSANQLMKMRLDSDGMLIGCVREGVIDDTHVFRYDWMNDSFIWVQSWAGWNGSSDGLDWWDIVEGINGDFLVSGQIRTGNNINDAALMGLERGTGNEIPGTLQTYDYSNTNLNNDNEVFTSVTTLNSQFTSTVYAVGRFTDPNRGLGGFRSTIVWTDEMNSNNNQEYGASIYLHDLASDARMYGSYIYYDERDTSLVTVTVGDPNGQGTNWRTYVAKHNLQGGLIWAKEYDIVGEGEDGETITGLIPSSNGGYIVYGYTSPTTASIDEDVFLMELDPVGNVVWERKYGGAGDEGGFSITVAGGSIVELDGHIYFVGRSNSYNTNGDTDVLIGKADLMGIIDDGSCVEDLGVVTTDMLWEGPFDALGFARNTAPTTPGVVEGGGLAGDSTVCGSREVGCASLNLSAMFVQEDSYLTQFNFTDVSTGGQIDFITWDFGDGETMTGQPGGSVSHTYAENGSYEVCVTVFTLAANGDCCKDTYCDTVVVDVDPCLFHFASFGWRAQSNGLATFTDDSPMGMYSVWDFGDGSPLGYSNGDGSTIMHQYANAGVYMVSLISIYHVNDSVCCKDTMTQLVRIRSRFPWVLFPTRVSNKVTVVYELPDEEPATLSLYDMDGQLRQEVVDSDGEESLDVEDLEKGVYFIMIHNSKFKEQRKFLKE